MVVKSTRETLEQILALLKRDEAFCYTRFGDSQLMWMEGWVGHAHEQLNSPLLKILMRTAFKVDDPAYLIAPSCGYAPEPGMGGNTFGLYKEDAELVATVEKYGLGQEYWHCEAIHYGLLYWGQLVKEIFAEINRHERVLIVGGFMLDVRQWFPKAEMIHIPMDNAFRYRDSILEDIYQHKPDLVLFSAGAISQVLQYFLFVDKPQITTINMGSVFNALLEITGSSIHTRGWIRDNLTKIQEFKKLL